MKTLFVFILILSTWHVKAAKYDECDSDLKKQITDLIKSDKDGIRSLQFKITLLKLAKQTTRNNVASVERLVKKEFSNLPVTWIQTKEQSDNVFVVPKETLNQHPWRPHQ